MCWCAPLPVKPRAYSINPPSLSNKIFLGGIPHDLNERKNKLYFSCLSEIVFFL
jgi:hypothetical protein